MAVVKPVAAWVRPIILKLEALNIARPYGVSTAEFRQWFNARFGTSIENGLPSVVMAQMLERLEKERRVDSY